MSTKLSKLLVLVIIATMVLSACAPAAPAVDDQAQARIAELEAQVKQAQEAAAAEADAKVAEIEAQIEEAKQSAAGEAEAKVAELEAQLQEAQTAADEAKTAAAAAAADAAATAAAAAAGPELAIPLEEFTSANINWKQVAEAAPEEGVSLHIAVVKHTFTESLIPLIPVFEELTGIKVFYDVLPQAEYWPKLQVDLSSGAGLIDVFMTGPELDWPYVTAGWTEPLDQYINDPKLTDLEWYDQADFYTAAWDANRVDVDKIATGEGYGTGPTYAIPVTYEIMSLAYRTDLFEEAGVVVDEGWPHTWQDIADAAKATTKDTNGDGTIDQFGILARGHRAWPSMFGGYSNVFYSYGAKDFDENLKPVVNSPEGIAATQLWVDMMKESAPPDTTDMQWFQVKQRFAQGEAAMSIDCDWFAAATYEQPDVSTVAGKLAYASTPPGPGGDRVQDLWFWSLGMTSAGYHKDASWLFIQWATSKPVMLTATRDFENWNPPRQSTWEDPDIVAMTEGWANYRAVVEENRNYSKVPHTAHPQAGPALDAWWGNIQDAILGTITVEEALDKAADEMYKVMDMAGVYE